MYPPRYLVDRPIPEAPPAKTQRVLTGYVVLAQAFEEFCTSRNIDLDITSEQLRNGISAALTRMAGK